MSGALPVVSGDKTVRALRRAGFEQVDQSGSHVKLRHPVTRRTVIVPLHRELKRGTLAGILRQAGMTAEEFRATLF